MRKLKIEPKIYHFIEHLPFQQYSREKDLDPPPISQLKSQLVSNAIIKTRKMHECQDINIKERMNKKNTM